MVALAVFPAYAGMIPSDEGSAIANQRCSPRMRR